MIASRPPPGCVPTSTAGASRPSRWSRRRSRAPKRARALGTFVHLQPERARADAREADVRRARGDLRSPLDGIPVAIKDLMVQEGEPCTCASRILEGFVAPYQGTVVAKLRAAGAVIIGRTNMDEFAMGSSTEHSVYGVARNPWDPARTPGGSSGGSAAAVAAGIVPIAFGSDTGGSIRQPASLCGVVGLKPTYGRVSRYGLVAFASSLDQIGPFAHTAGDCALALAAIAGHDPADSTSLPEPVPDFAAAQSGDVSGLVVGLPREYFAEGADPAVLACVREAVAELERAGAKTREVSLPHAPYAIATYYLIATAEASSNLARYDGVRYGRRAEADSLGEMYRRTRSQGLRRRGEAPHPARHLRALGGLLRRLLPQGDAGAHAAAPRLRGSLPRLRPDRDADGARGGVPARREDRRPAARCISRTSTPSPRTSRASPVSRSPAAS